MPSGVYKRTKETNRKNSEAKKGNQYALGYHHTEEAKQVEQSLKG